MQLTPSQLETLRSHPQSSTLHLSVFQPQIVFKARVNDAGITTGARTITYDTVTFGSYLSLVSNATLWIGTTEGGNDVGKIRIRSATPSVVTISENSNIKWATGLYLTGFYYVELWPIYPRIINNPSNPEDVIFYKDWDISYTNQGSILGTFPNAGPHRGLFRGERVYYSSTGTFNVLGDALAYSWAFEGGSPTGSVSADPGNVTYNTPGHYVTRLTISNASGGTDTTYRYVSVYDRFGQGNNTPVGKWELLNLNGSRDEGGYSGDFRIHENVNIQENSVIVLFSEDNYNGTDISLGGNHPNAQKIFFVGYVMGGTIHYDYARSYVEFSAVSLTGLMKNSLGFSVSVESKAAPAKWFEVLDMDCRRAIYHYLKWHTTAMNIGDFEFKGTDYKIQFFDADRASMYDAIDNLMRNTLIGKVVSDRQGKTWMEVDARAYSNPTGTFTSTIGINTRDWIDEPTVDRKFSDEVSYIEMGGIAYSGVVTGTFSALLADAPGSSPSFRGEIETIEGLAIGGQGHLNQLVGNVFANKNTEFSRIGMKLAGNYRNFDIAPQETAQISILPSETILNAPINGLYLPDGMDWMYDAKDQILLAGVDWLNLVSGNPGSTVIIPDPEDVENGFGVPGIQIPPIPTLTTSATVAAAAEAVTGQYRVVETVRTLPSGPTVVTVEANRGAIIGLTTPDLSVATGMIDFLITQPGLYFCTANVGYSASSGPLATLTTTTGLVRRSASFVMPAGTWSTYTVVEGLFFSTIPFTLSLNNASPGNAVFYATLEVCRIAI